MTNPDGSVRQAVYLGPAVQLIDEAGVARLLTYNGLGQLKQADEGSPTVSTTYNHYVFGPLGKVNQAGQQQRTFTHDWLGRMLNETHPESGTMTYQHDDDSRVISRTDARGITTYQTYDSIDRPRMTSYTDGTPTVDRTYDQSGYTGLLTSISDGAGWTNFTYNSLDQLTSEQRTLNGVPGLFTTNYSYDVGGRLRQITYPSGRVVTRNYQTSTDRLNTLTDWPTNATLVSGVQDNPAGFVTSRTLGGGLVEGHGFNVRNQLTGITASYGANTLLNVNYGYGTTNNNGRIRNRTDYVQPEHSASYTLDAMNRLTTVTGVSSNWSINWGLDNFGNRTSQTPSGLASSKVGAQTMVYFNNRNTSWGYDAAGNVTNDGLHSYAYDGEGRIKYVDGGAVQFVYDGDGRRVKKIAGSTTTYYFYGLTGLMSEFSTVAGPTSAASTDRLQYRIGEQTGTAVLTVSPSGTVLETNRVLPYGEIWSSFTSSSNDQKFTTYDRESVSGLDYAMARFYGNRYGRFMSPDVSLAGVDPTEPQSWNLYTYVTNDPINFIDPSGEDPCVNGVNPVTGNLCVDVNAPDPGPGFIPAGMCAEIVRDGIPVGNTCDSSSQPGSVLDRVQTGLDVAGMVPAVGEIADLANAGIYALRGKWFDAGLSMAALLPIGGQAFTGARRLNKLVQKAAKQFPNKAGKIEWHHAVPKYLGGAVNGLLVNVNAAYHQQITNAFRTAWDYGRRQPTAAQLTRILNQVYSQYPLPR